MAQLAEDGRFTETEWVFVHNRAADRVRSVCISQRFERLQRFFV
jgi:hypothetical protein